MASEGSVTHWIVELKAGDEAALGKLWQRYWPLVVELARRKLKGTRCRAADEEDVAQNTFWSFYRSLQGGRLPRLENRQDLMALLVIITARKAASQIEHEERLKRGAGHVQGESGLEILAGSGLDIRGMERARDLRRPQPLTPEEEAILRDCYEQYMGRLPESLRDFAEHYLAGFSYEEIAQMKDCSRKTVQRKIQVILDKWQAMASESLSPIT